MCAHLTQETQPSYYHPICSLHYSRSASKHNENVCHLWSSVIFGCTIYELETYTSHLRLDLIKSWGILFTSITCTSLRLYKLISVAQILHTLYTLATSFFTTACVLLTVIMHVTEYSFDIHVHIVYMSSLVTFRLQMQLLIIRLTAYYNQRLLYKHLNQKQTNNDWSIQIIFLSNWVCTIER